jgi:hypothetical protein
MQGLVNKNSPNCRKSASFYSKNDHVRSVVSSVPPNPSLPRFSKEKLRVHGFTATWMVIRATSWAGYHLRIT